MPTGWVPSATSGCATVRSSQPLPGSTYTLGDADVGTQISVQVSYTDGQGTPESVTSAQTAAVANVNDAPTGAVVDRRHVDRRPDLDG